MRPTDILRAQAKFENPRQGFFPGPKPDVETIIQDSYRTDIPNTLNKAKYTYINGKITKKRSALYKVTANEKILQDAIDAFTPEAAIQQLNSPAGPGGPVGPGGPNVLNDYSKLRALDNQRIVNEYLQKTAREKQAILDDDRVKKQTGVLNRALIDQVAALKKINQAISLGLQGSLGNIQGSIDDQTRLLEANREDLIQEIRNTYLAINDLNRNLFEQQALMRSSRTGGPPDEFLMTPIPPDRQGQPEQIDRSDLQGLTMDQLDSNIASYVGQVQTEIDKDPLSDLDTATRTDNQPPVIPLDLYTQQLYLVPVKDPKKADYVKLKNEGTSSNSGKYLPYNPSTKKYKTGFENSSKTATRDVRTKAEKYYRLERKPDPTSLSSNVLPVSQLIEKNVFYSDKPDVRDALFSNLHREFATELVSNPKK